MGYGGGGVPCLVNHTFYSCDYSCALFLASVQESNKGKSFQHTNLDTGAFLGQGTSEKIYIGKSRMKLFSDGQNVPADDKMFSKLTKQNCQKWKVFLRKFPLFLPIFQSFESFSFCGGCGRDQISPGWCSLVDNEGNLKV